MEENNFIYRMVESDYKLLIETFFSKNIFYNIIYFCFKKLYIILKNTNEDLILIFSLSNIKIWKINPNLKLFQIIFYKNNFLDIFY